MAWGPIAAIGGGMLANFLGQKEANVANSASADRQMNFQEHMSSTAHQREVKDLAAAGLNPMLSVNSGASSPTGAMSVAQNTMAGGLSTALETAQLFQAMKKQEKEIGLIDAQTKKTNVEGRVISKDLPKGDAISDVWKRIRPLFNKTLDNVQRSVSPKPSPQEKYKQDYMKDFDKRMKQKSFPHGGLR